MNKNTKSSLELFTACLTLFCISLVILYFFELKQRQGKFLPNTIINGINYEGMTAEEAERYFRSMYYGRDIVLLEMDNKQESISRDEIGYEIIMEKSFEDFISEQNYYSWPARYFSKTEHDVNTTL